jgi:hypothetical protein
MKKTWILLYVLLYVGCGSTDGTPDPVLSSKFSDIQKNTFNKSCANGGCHDAVTQKALLCLKQDSCYSQLMTHPIQARQGARRFTKLVFPGNADSSFLIYKLLLTQQSNDYGEPMPERLARLPQNQIDAILKWINDGAKNN